MKLTKTNKSEKPKIIVLVILIIILVELINFVSGYGLFSEWMIPAAIGLLLIYGNGYVVYKVFKVKKSLAPWSILLTSMISTATLYVLYGLLRDIRGDYCPGFMGVSESCVESALFPVVVFGAPLFLMAIGIVFIFFMDKMMKEEEKVKGPSSKIRKKK